METELLELRFKEAVFQDERYQQVVESVRGQEKDLATIRDVSRAVDGLVARLESL